MGNGHCCPYETKKESTMYSNKEQLSDNIHIVLEHSPTSHVKSDKKGVEKLTVSFYRPKYPRRSSTKSVWSSESTRLVETLISKNTEEKKTAELIILESNGKEGKEGKEENFIVKAESHFKENDVGFMKSVLGIVEKLSEKKSKETKVYLKYTKNLKKHMKKILYEFLQIFLSLSSIEGSTFTLCMEIDDLETYLKIAKRVKYEKMRRSSILTEMKMG